MSARRAHSKRPPPVPPVGPAPPATVPLSASHLEALHRRGRLLVLSLYGHATLLGGFGSGLGDGQPEARREAETLATELDELVGDLGELLAEGAARARRGAA